jgi:NAD(P)-dependent dehydrogenase (short-subunit alcohol dehydrogenase family)
LFFFSIAAANKMKGKGGKIGMITKFLIHLVNIGSIDGLHPSGMLCHYDSSKGGVHMLTKSLALELAPFNIQVNEIMPGNQVE